MGDKTATADKPAITWLDQPEEHDYPAAQSYLNLLSDDKKTADLVTIVLTLLCHGCPLQAIVAAYGLDGFDRGMM